MPKFAAPAVLPGVRSDRISSSSFVGLLVDVLDLPPVLRSLVAHSLLPPPHTVNDRAPFSAEYATRELQTERESDRSIPLSALHCSYRSDKSLLQSETVWTCTL
ncbi:hypothetical protein KC19_1G253800 [Ceratodon purpureus]|uniref:Uncharacterized protein n=1 Tax=Ceratodon purpureus TaxID=3225 RepID=A0A8T0JBT9_CERPU|nr:hypothetical protein KC19_1G253800 [Ceratodon purpureus]